MKLVISAVNFTEGGPLTVLQSVTREAARHFPDWQIHVLVHQVGITGVSAPNVIELPFPKSKRSWFYRLYLEWFRFDRLSRELQPDVWLALHDVTPRVQAGRQYVYCHNPAPFCDQPIPAAHHEPAFRVFRRFYGFLYRILIHRNAAVVVQQDWIRRIFTHDYGVRRVIVAHPDTPATGDSPPMRRSDPPRRFIYPALPRVFKNLELIGECVSRLERDPRWSGEIAITVDGSENGYAREIRQRYGHLKTLRFIGRQSAAGMAAAYADSDALIFPSLLETWGLPLTEAKNRGLPILAADLPYARETVGSCERVRFFDPLDADALAALMLDLHEGRIGFDAVQRPEPQAPFARSWRELLQILLIDDAAKTPR